VAVVDTVTGSLVLATGDELASDDRPFRVRKSDPTTTFRDGRVEPNLNAKPSLYVLNSIWEARVELLADAVDVCDADLARIREAFYEPWAANFHKLEAHYEANPDMGNRYYETLGDEPNLTGPRWDIRPKFKAMCERLDTENADKYRSPERLLESIERYRRLIFQLGREITAQERTPAEKAEVIDKFVIALTVNPERISQALRVIRDDKEMTGEPPLPTLEKIKRLRMLSIRRGVERVAEELRGFSPQEVEEYARSTDWKTFDAGLQHFFPGLTLTQEKRHLLHETINDQDQCSKYKEKGYLWP